MEIWVLFLIASAVGVLAGLLSVAIDWFYQVRERKYRIRPAARIAH